MSPVPTPIEAPYWDVGDWQPRLADRVAAYEAMGLEASALEETLMEDSLGPLNLDHLKKRRSVSTASPTGSPGSLAVPKKRKSILRRSIVAMARPMATLDENDGAEDSPKSEPPPTAIAPCSHFPAHPFKPSFDRRWGAFEVRRRKRRRPLSRRCPTSASRKPSLPLSAPSRFTLPLALAWQLSIT